MGEKEKVMPAANLLPPRRLSDYLLRLLLLLLLGAPLQLFPPKANHLEGLPRDERGRRWPARKGGSLAIQR